MNFALITPSYEPDFERCKLLVESSVRFSEDGLVHYIIVDRRDVPLFKQLEGPQTKLLIVEDILPWYIFRVPGIKKFWISLKTKPIRNWVLQQLVKMSMANVLDEKLGIDAFIFVDSDVTFVRPFDTSMFLHDEKLRLNRVDYTSNDHHKWHRNARELLQISDPPSDGDPMVREKKDWNYVASLVTWRRENVIKMQQHIERCTRKNWLRSVVDYWDLSEYMIYGNFVENVLGLEAAGHYASDTPILHLSWGYEFESEPDVDRFLDGLMPEHIGIMIHSKDAIPVDLYRSKIEELWARQDAVAAS